jgi:monoamine oxidase
MSRSRILRRIRRELLAQVERIEPRHPVLSRGALLRLGGLSAAWLAIPKASSASAPRRTLPRIGIVGAGISGLTAALTLHDRGVPCTVFEASSRVGGRMHSNGGFWAEGQVAEWCGEFIDTDHRVMRHLAGRFGLMLADVNAAEPKDSIDTNYFFGEYYEPGELARDLKAIAPIVSAQARAIGPSVRYDHYTKAGYAFDHLSAYDWIETYVPGGHDSRVGRYLDVGIRTENGPETRRQSSLNFLIGVNSDERFHIQGGNEQLPQAIAANLPAGTLQLNAQLTSVAATADETVTLSFATPAGQVEAVFDYVILTLPFSVLRTLDLQHAGFDARKRADIAELAYGTNSKLELQFDSRYWNQRGAWGRISDGFIDTDLAFQQTWDSSRAEPGADGLLTDYTGGRGGAAYRPDGPYTTSQSSAKTAAYARRFLEQLDIVWPGISAHYGGLAALSYPTGDPNLLGSYSSRDVGQYTKFGGYEGVPQGRIFFGGEHTSYRFQGFMEGGAEEGRRAALEVLAASR